VDDPREKDEGMNKKRFAIIVIVCLFVIVASIGCKVIEVNIEWATLTPDALGTLLPILETEAAGANF
jgi:hypothetical protein